MTLTSVTCPLLTFEMPHSYVIYEMPHSYVIYHIATMDIRPSNTKRILQGGEDAYDALSLEVIFRKRAL